MNDEDCPCRQRSRLQGNTENLRKGRISVADIRCLPGNVPVFRILAVPGFSHGACHAHGMDNLGVADRALRKGVAHVGGFRLPFGQRTRALVGQKRQDGENQRSADRDVSDRRVEQETDHDIKGKPGQIEHRGRAHAGQEGSYLVEITQGLKPVATNLDLQRRFDERPKNPPVHHLVKRTGNANEHSAPENFERPLKSVKN